MSPERQAYSTPLQNHARFFDSNNDGVITPWDVYSGFRRIGFGIPLSVAAVSFINVPFSLMTCPHWWPDPLFRVYTANLHKGLHGSDQEVYDKDGNLRPKELDDLFKRWDRGNKGGLSIGDVWRMTQAARDAFDAFGWVADKLEWFARWLVAADDQGLLRKEVVQGVYDGSLWYKLEDKYTHKKKLGGVYDSMRSRATLPGIITSIKNTICTSSVGKKKGTSQGSSMDRLPYQHTVASASASTRKLFGGTTARSTAKCSWRIATVM